MTMLSILVCRLKNRRAKYNELRKILDKQMVRDVEVLNLEDEGQMPIGTKRNALLLAAKGKYVSFIDDDDRVSGDYIQQVMPGMIMNADCCSLVGEITFDGKDPKIFVHSIDNDHYYEKGNVYYRPPNHLNVIKTDIARQFKFPRINHGEDTDWAMQLCRSNMLQDEYKTTKTIYYYDYRSDK